MGLSNFNFQCIAGHNLIHVNHGNEMKPGTNYIIESFLLKILKKVGESDQIYNLSN